MCRSGAFIAEHYGPFPTLPLPDPAYLRQDYASCVGQVLPECRYDQGEEMLGQPQLGHRRQMSQFCGQERWCGDFNSQRVMMAAMVITASLCV